MSISARDKGSDEGHRITWWAGNTFLWMVAAFLVALAFAVAVVGHFGTGERGLSIALRVTARWSFFLFWFAYSGGAMARLFGIRFAELARRGRDFGLAFASAQVIHVGLVLWLLYLTPPGSRGGMIFFWVGILCTYLLALLSLPLIRNTLEPWLWRALRTAAMEYIALAFAADFILLRLQANGFSKYPLSYLPFAALLIAGTGLRVAAGIRQRLPQYQQKT